MPAEDALGIGIDYKAMLVPGIKKYAISGFRTDAIDGQKPVTDDLSAAIHHSLDAGAVFFNQYVNKVAKALGLDIKVAGWANQLCQLFMAKIIYLFCRENLGCLEVGNGVLNIFP